MKRLSRLAAAAMMAATAHATANAQAPTQGSKPMPAPIVFFDIAGPDNAVQKAFYNAVLGIETDAMGQFQAPVLEPTLRGLLRTEPKEVMIYFGVDDVTATLEKVTANGGTIHAPRFEVPGVVVLGLCIDPAGNRFGLVEMRDGKPYAP